MAHKSDLAGLTVRGLRARRRRLVFVCEGGPLGRVTVPESWTDRGPAPAAHRLSVAVLVELDTLLTMLEQR